MTDSGTATASNLLVVDAGSSSLHLSVVDGEGRELAARHETEAPGSGTRQVIEELPDIATVERSKAEREGRVYVDVMQNAKGHHAVPPYVVRATPGATVSTPLDWKEVNARLDPKRFDIRSVFARFKKQRTDPMAKLAAS